ncbi:BTB/POZ and MATH domain-containing protein 6 [Drosophila ficusphila]|uniref:BTB/POZ and MATH domain-containing protein 6 n=1 Tax=Drosophila ficusphila TaxID=30025 RepID=UPI0007E5DDD7|nr:BTB/POZ and MATH domain-containing protein 6 [Drosophila ficusphila]
MSVFSKSSWGTKLLKSGLFSDVCIYVGDSSFRCHKIVLACASKFFEKLFQHDDEQTGEVTLEGVTPEVFKMFLEFIYKPNDDQLDDLEPELLMSVLKCANMWLATEVEGRCAKILLTLCEYMEPNTLFRLYAVSFFVDHELLMIVVVQFLHEKWPHKIDCPSTAKMELDCFKEYFQSTKKIISELRRFNMIENWFNENNFDSKCSSITDQITDMLKSIDFQEMTLKEIFDGPGKSNVLSDTFAYRYNLLNSLKAKL